MAEKKACWGLLSTARINERVIPAIRSSGRSELLAVASRSKERAQAYAKQWDIPYVPTARISRCLLIQQLM